jgi:2-phosphosulfolactate phosphatase
VCGQSAYRIRFDWGASGLRACAAGADAVVIVDVLSFSTAVNVACSRGGEVFPYRWGDDGGAAAFAAERGAVLAGQRGRPGYSLSPVSLRAIWAGTRLVLPSPNGATLSVAAAGLGPRVYAGCLRNASAVAAAVRDAGTVAVIAAGERWPDGSLRPAVEDLAGAGAILAELDPARMSPEAAVAVAASRVGVPLPETVSGRELVGGGFVLDVVVAAESDVSPVVPVLVDGERYVALG